MNGSFQKDCAAILLQQVATGVISLRRFAHEASELLHTPVENLL